MGLCRMAYVPHSLETAKMLLAAFPVGAGIQFIFTLAEKSDDKKKPITIRMKVEYKGVVTGHSGDNLNVTVTEGKDLERPNSKPSKISKNMSISPESLVPTDKDLPPRIVITGLSPPSKGGRRKTRKHKKRSKKTRSKRV